MPLNDPKLFRQQAYIDGVWVDADNGQTLKVNNPATGEIIGSVPKMGAAETRRAIEAADKALPAWRALTAKDRANNAAQVVRPDDGQPGRPGPPDDPRTRQATGRVPWRNRLRRLLPRVVRRRSQARLRRHDPRSPGRQAPDGAQAADRCHAPPSRRGTSLRR